MVTAFDVYDTIAFTLHANSNEISNRTTIQKLIYFYTLRIEKLNISYQNHFYGPYSSTVASALDEMVAFSYLDVRITMRYNYESYHYTLTPPGENYAKSRIDFFPKEYKIIEDTVQTCNNHCKLNATQLSYSAKAHYILTHTRHDEYTIQDIKEVAKKFDWNLSETNAEEGMKLLKNLQLDSSI